MPTHVTAVPYICCNVECLYNILCLASQLASLQDASCIQLELYALRFDWSPSRPQRVHKLRSVCQTVGSIKIQRCGLFAKTVHGIRMACTSDHSCDDCMKVGIVHGEMTKICPHTSTGRADYFGSVVNRAARLLCAASAGQTLVEALVMEDVLKQWSGDAYNLAPVPGPSGNATLGAALLSSGALPLLEMPGPGPVDAEQSMTPRIKSAPQLSPLEILEDPSNDAPPAEAELQLMPSEEAPQPDPPIPLELTQAGRSESGGTKGWTPRAPQSGMHMGSSLALGKSKLSKQAVSFAPAGVVQREGRTAAFAAVSPGRSIDGVIYSDSEVQQLRLTDSCCAPFAAGDFLAVGNCHMLKFLAASGVIQGRQEDVVAPQRLSHKSGKSVSRSAQPGSRRSSHDQEPPPRHLSSGSGSSSVGDGGSRINSLKSAADFKATGLATPRVRGTRPDCL